MPVVDVLGGSAVDITMVVTLAHVYAIPLTWVNARALIESILKAAGWVMLGEAATNLSLTIFNSLTLGSGKFLTGAAARRGGGLRLGHRRPGGQVLLRTWRIVGRRSAQDRRHPNPASHRQAIRAGTPEERNPTKDSDQPPRRRVNPAAGTTAPIFIFCLS